MIWLLLVGLAVWWLARELRGLRQVDEATVLLLADLGDESTEIRLAAEKVRRARERRAAMRAWFRGR